MLNQLSDKPLGAAVPKARKVIHARFGRRGRDS